MPVYVGTDANISYQGSPRVENPQRDQGPFEGQPGRVQPPLQRTPPPSSQAPTPPPGINLAPGSAPTDIFRPSPPPSAPNPSPKEQVPPQSKSSAAPEGGASSPAAALVAVEDGTPILLDFDPSYLTLAVGQQQTVHIRATSPGGFPGGPLRIRFDPSVAARRFGPARPRRSRRPDGRPDRGPGCRARASGLARTSRGRARSPRSRCGASHQASRQLAFEPVEMPGATVTFSTAVVSVR